MAQGHLITVIRHGNMVEQASVRSSSADFTESQLNHFDASRHPGFCVFFNFLDHDYQFSTIVPISFPQTTSIKAPGLVTSKRSEERRVGKECRARRAAQLFRDRILDRRTGRRETNKC